MATTESKGLEDAQRNGWHPTWCGFGVHDGVDGELINDESPLAPRQPALADGSWH